MMQVLAVQVWSDVACPWCYIGSRRFGHGDELVAIAVDAGLERDAVMAALGDGRHEADVEADRRRAGSLGIGAIPFYVIDDTLGVSGAQAPETFAAALERAVSEGPRAEVP